MKILHVTPVYPPHLGGVEQYVYNLVKRQRSLGHNVRVITSNLSSNNLSEANVFRLPVLYNFKGDWGEMPICPTIFSALKHIDCDVIHGHISSRFFTESIPIYSLFAQKKGPVVLSHHYSSGGLTFVRKALAYVHDLTFTRMLLRSADAIIALTESSKKILSSIFAVSSDKIEVIPPGIDVEKFNPKRYSPEAAREKYQIFEENIVLYMGRLIKCKGVDYLIKALPIVRKEIPNTTLVIAGDGPLRMRLQRLSHEVDIDQFVKFIGQIKHDDIPKVISMANAVVLPSLAEVFGVVLIEAMSMEKPVVATRIAGLCEAVMQAPCEVASECETGISVEKGSEDELAKAIVLLLSDRKLALRMGKRGRELVKKRYDWRIVAPRILEVYKRVLKNY